MNILTSYRFDHSKPALRRYWKELQSQLRRERKASKHERLATRSQTQAATTLERNRSD